MYQPRSSPMTASATENLLHTIPPLELHQDTWLTLEQTMQERRFDMPFRKTYQYEGEYIDAFHRWLAFGPKHSHGMIDIGIEGWLLPQDALKLYEMAYFSDDILELGTYKGLSTSILANAVFNSNRPRSIVTVDLSAELSAKAEEDMQSRLILGRENVHFFVYDAMKFTENLGKAGRQFSFGFIDHSHVYEHVRECCMHLHTAIKPGGFVLFHDYNDPRNPDPASPDYGVFQGVNEGIRNFQFYGVYGCTSLWRRV